MRIAIAALVLFSASCEDPAPATGPAEAPTARDQTHPTSPEPTSPAPTSPAPTSPEPTSPEPTSPEARTAALQIRPPTDDCARALVRDHAGARIAAAIHDDDVPIACLDGPGAPEPAATVSERVDVLAEGDGGCDRRLRFTFRHDGIVVSTRCPDRGQLVVEAESTRGTQPLATLDVDWPIEVTVPWAGDWNGDGRLEWIVRVGDHGDIRYLGAFGLRDDDTVATLAEHRH